MTEFLVSLANLGQVLSAQRQTARHVGFIRAGGQEQTVTYVELYDRARMVLHHLQDKGIRRGDELILLLNDNRQFLELFWACLLGGIVPVPLAVGIADDQRLKMFRVYARLRNPFLCTTHALFERLNDFAKRKDMGKELKQVRKNTILTESLHVTDARGEIADVARDETAFIQFSSGSTSEPKGVVLTHGNILSNIRDIIVAADFTADDVSLSWMPLTHDMGLIGFHINMLCAGMEHYLMETEIFIRRPILWLEQASYKRTTVLCSPNFGYRHFLKSFDKRGMTEDIDLSSVRLVFNGAEPISPQLCQEFTDKLAPFGLQRNVMFPVYGLAEASLAVAFPERNCPLTTRWLDRRSTAMGDRAVPHADTKAGLGVVAVGQPIGECQVKITDQQGTVAPEGTVGRVLISGPNVTSGYYQQPELTKRVVDDDGWLDTGDLGVVLDGELYITGRSKDVIFVNGQNFYAHDLEIILQEVEGLELGKVVASAARPVGADQEELVFFVLHRGDLQSFVSLRLEISRVIGERTGAQVAQVVPVKTIPKTTSGKIQRFALAEAYNRGEFNDVLERLGRLNVEPVRTGTENIVEEELLAICDQVLGEHRLGRDDNFFDLGANSLKLIQVHSLIDERYPGVIEVTDMFDYPTIQELAAFILSKQSTQAAAS